MATIPVSFRLPALVHQAFSEKADKAGMSLTDFFKAAIINNQSMVMTRERNSKDQQHLLFLFSQASNNLNLLAHSAHSDQQSGALSARHYQQLIAQLSAIRVELQQGVADAD